MDADMFVEQKVIDIITSGRGVALVLNRHLEQGLQAGMYLAIDDKGDLWKVSSRKGKALQFTAVVKTGVKCSVLVPHPAGNAKALSINELDECSIEQILSFFGVKHPALAKALEAKMLGYKTVQ